MLVLLRRIGERILIGEDTWVTVLWASPDLVKLGIDAPKDVLVMREELINRIQVVRVGSKQDSKEQDHKEQGNGSY